MSGASVDTGQARVWHDLRDAQAWSLPEFASRAAGANSAGTEAQMDKPPTAAELDALQKQAYQEAWADGQAKGYAAGLAQGQEKIAEGVERLHILASALSAPLDELDRDLEYSLSNLALILAKRIVGRTVHDDPQALKSLVQQAVAMLGSEIESPLEVALNSHDLAFLREHELLESSWTMRLDDSLQSGDVRVKRGMAEVDGRLQQRLDRLAAEMLHG